MTDQKPPRRPRTSVRRRAEQPRKNSRPGGRLLGLALIALMVAVGWWYLQKGADDSGGEFDDLGDDVLVTEPRAGDVPHSQADNSLLRRLFTDVWRVLRPQTIGRDASQPRIWAT